MNQRPSDDHLERELRSYLDWQASQLSGAPSVDEVSARIASRIGTPPRTWPTGRLIWAFVIAGLLLTLAIGAVLVGSGRPQPIHLVAPTASTRASAGPSSGPTPSGSAVAGPCAIPGVLTPGHDVAVPLGGPAASDPANGRVAVVGRGPTQIWLAGAGVDGPKLLATSNITRGQSPAVIGSSADGSILLITTRNFAGAGPATHKCGDLFLVRTDGSAVTKLTDNPPGDAADGAALGPDGRSVAYVENGVTQTLHLIDATGVDRVLDPSACGGGQPGGLAWSPDGTRLAVSCDTGVASTSGLRIYPAVGGPPQAVGLPAGSTEAGFGWAADGRHILVATVPASEPQNHLSVLSISPDSGAATVVSRARLSVEWAIPFPANPFSPDRKWLLATGGAPGSHPGTNFNEVLYLVDVATGAARQVVSQPDSLGTFRWLADNSGFVYSDTSSPNLNLLELNVASGTAKTIGFIPGAVSYYWIGP